MNARELWQKLIDEKCASFDSTKKVLTPLKHLKIKGDVIKNLTKDDNGKITINLEHRVTIDHPGENIDYSLYGTPRLSMGA